MGNINIFYCQIHQISAIVSLPFLTSGLEFRFLKRGGHGLRFLWNHCTFIPSDPSLIRASQQTDSKRVV